MEVKEFLKCVEDEVAAAQKKHPPLNSMHEAYAVILEELDELWDQVRKRKEERNDVTIFTELVQIAAMATRTACGL